MLSSLFNPKQIAVQVLNRLLQREAWAMRKNAVHAGKIVRLNVSNYTINLVILNTGLVDLIDSASKPNVSLTISNESLNQLPTAIHHKASLDELSSLMHIEGDAGLARLVSELARDLRWDIEAELSTIVGSFMANIIMSTLRKAKQVSQDFGQKSAANVSEFLSHESKILVPGVVLQGLRDDIKALQQQMDQLDKRIATLKKSKGHAV